MTQLLEVVGVFAADRRLKKPFEPHRPSWMKRKDEISDPGMVNADTEGAIRGHAAIMAKVKGQGHLRVVPDAS